MTTYSSSDIVNAAQELSQTMATELQELTTLRQSNSACLQETIGKRDAVGRQLAQSLLPVLTPDALALLLQHLGNPFSGGPDPIVTREEDRQAKHEALSDIERDSRYPGRERLVADLEYEEKEVGQKASMEQEILTQSQHPRLDHLLTVEYGTPAYAVGWWCLSYYDDWKAGDEIAERFPGQPEFRRIREMVLKARHVVEAAREKTDELKRQIAEIHDLAGRAQDLRRLLAELDDTHLQQAHQRIVTFLLEGDEGEMAQRLSGDMRLTDAFKSLRGLAAKAQYLETIDGQIEANLEQCREMKAKADRDAAKYGRPKRFGETLESSEYERRYLVPGQRFRRRREHFAGMTSSLWGYEEYDRWDPHGNMLWWDLFTAGRYDGDFIPGVADWHRDHPDYRRRSHLDDAQAAAVTAGLLHGQGQDFSMLDAS